MHGLCVCIHRRRVTVCVTPSVLSHSFLLWELWCNVPLHLSRTFPFSLRCTNPFLPHSKGWHWALFPFLAPAFVVFFLLSCCFCFDSLYSAHEGLMWGAICFMLTLACYLCTQRRIFSSVWLRIPCRVVHLLTWCFSGNVDFVKIASLFFVFLFLPWSDFSRCLVNS